MLFQVRVAALQNLVKIMSLYYQYMETYMGPALFAVRHHKPLFKPESQSESSQQRRYSCHFLFQITIEAMKSDIDEVALQGIEFWSNVCDEEMDLAIEASEVSVTLPLTNRKFFFYFLFVHGSLSFCLVQSQASEQGRPPEHTSKFYAKGALQYLVPILTQTLTKQVAQLSEPHPVYLSVALSLPV